MWETWLWYLGRENPLKKEMVTHSSTLAWRISWTEKPGRLQSTGSQRVGHNWATSLDWTGLYWVFAYLLCSHLSLQLEYNLGETYFIWIFRTLDREQWEMNAAAAAKLLQSCPTLCDPRDGSPTGSPVPGILQARTLEWVAISFSNAWKWKVKVKLLSHVRLLATPRTAAYQAPLSMGFSRQEYWSGVPLPSPMAESLKTTLIGLNPDCVICKILGKLLILSGCHL